MLLGRVAGPEAEDIVMTAGEELIQEGFEKGFEKAKRGTLLDLLRQRFGSEVNAAVEARLAAASVLQISKWLGHFVSSSSLAELLAD